MWRREREMQPLPQGIYNKNIAVLCQNVTATEMCVRSAKGFTSILAEKQSCSSDWLASFSTIVNHLPEPFHENFGCDHTGST